MVKYRSHSIEFKRQIAQEFLAGETLHGLAKRHDISRNLIRVWVERYQTGAFDEDAAAADLLQQYEARIAALERLVGKQALELEFLKGALRNAPPAEKRDYVRDCRPEGISVAEGCRLMGISRSAYYDAPVSAPDDTAIVQAMGAICDEFERYGWRRVQAALRQQGVRWSTTRRSSVSCANTISSHASAGVMWRRRTATTTHPIFRNLAKDISRHRR